MSPTPKDMGGKPRSLGTSGPLAAGDVGVDLVFEPTLDVGGVSDFEREINGRNPNARGVKGKADGRGDAAIAELQAAIVAIAGDSVARGTLLDATIRDRDAHQAVRNWAAMRLAETDGSDGLGLLAKLPLMGGTSAVRNWAAMRLAETDGSDGLGLLAKLPLMGGTSVAGYAGPDRLEAFLAGASIVIRGEERGHRVAALLRAMPNDLGGAYRAELANRILASGDQELLDALVQERIQRPRENRGLNIQTGQALAMGALKGDGIGVVKALTAMRERLQAPHTERLLLMRVIGVRLDDLLDAIGGPGVTRLVRGILMDLPTNEALKRHLDLQDSRRDVLSPEHLRGYSAERHGFLMVVADLAFETKLAAVDIYAQLNGTVSEDVLLSLKANSDILLSLWNDRPAGK